MKRPQGLDGRPPTARPTARTARPTAKADPDSAKSGAQQRAQPAATARSNDASARRSPRPPGTPASAAPSAPERSARPARSRRPPDPVRQSAREARRAARERKRFERAEVRRFTHRSRKRRLAWAVAGAMTVGFAAAVAIAAFSPIFALRTVEVVGAERIDPAIVHEALAPEVGRPLAFVDDAAVRERLSDVPLIRSLVTEVVLPDTLVVRLVEREPVAVVRAGSGFDLVDPAGVVVESAAERPEGMPMIEPADIDVDSAAFRSIGRVLHALPSDVLSRVDTVTAHTRDDVTLVLHGSNQRVVWGGAERSDEKADALALLVERHGDDGRGYYDLTASNAWIFHPE